MVRGCGCQLLPCSTVAGAPVRPRWGVDTVLGQCTSIFSRANRAPSVRLSDDALARVADNTDEAKVVTLGTFAAQ